MEMMNQIAAASMNMSMSQVQQNAQYSLMKKTMDSTEQAAQEMLKMMPPTPGMGQSIDTYA